MISTYLRRMPLIAILRGLTPEEALPVGQVLVDEGFTIIEVPLNSPEPIESIRVLADTFGGACLVGAGTVMRPDEIERVAAAGGRLIVMPHSDPALIRAAKAAGLACAPGVATPTEAFAALAAGADLLKLFPAEQIGPNVLQSWRAVFPRDTLFAPVGGITPDNLGLFHAVGANGFGIGSALYRPGMEADEVRKRAAGFVAAWRRRRAPG